MSSGTAPDPFFARRVRVPTAVVALLSALFFALVLHLGLGSGGGLSAPASLGAGDHAAFRQSLLSRDNLRPVVAAEHGDRTSAPPPSQPPTALVSVIAAASRRSGFRRWRALASAFPNRRHVTGNRPRAPPIAA